MKRISKVLRHWLEVDGSILSAAVTFYAALALFPILIVLLSLFGLLLANSEYFQDWRTQILDLITEQTSETFSEIVSSQLTLIQEHARLTGVIGLFSLFAFSMAFFSNLERAFCRIWQLPNETFGFWSKLKRILFDRLRAYLMILLLALIVLINFVFNMYLKKLGDQLLGDFSGQSIHLAAEIALNGIMFTGIFQIMTREKNQMAERYLRRVPDCLALAARQVFNRHVFDKRSIHSVWSRGSVLGGSAMALLRHDSRPVWGDGCLRCRTRRTNRG